MPYRNASDLLLPETVLSDVRYVNGSWTGETLYGSAGSDQFDGGGGRDTLVGGAGDDFYWVRDTKDVIQEAAFGGVDTARIYASYTLPQNVENLVVFGNLSFAAGNNGDNIIQGLDGDQFIYGARGQDVLIGGNGGDTFIVKQGEDNKVIQDFQPGADHLRLVGGNLYNFAAVKQAMSQRGADVVLDNGGTTVTFRGANLDQFVERDFQLPLNKASLGGALFSEDFNAMPSGAAWATNYGYAGDGLNSFTLPNNQEKQLYVSAEFKGTTGAPIGVNPFSVSNGVLTITAEPVSPTLASKMWGYQYTSGMLSSSYTQTYGYFEIRAELPAGQGLWPAFWLLGPDNNEIDILEQLGSAPEVPFNALHSNMVPAIGLQNYVPNDGGFHTYGALWNKADVIYYVDGTEVWRTPTPADMNKPMHMIVNLAIGGPWAGAPDNTTPFPAHMNVDYIKTWGLPTDAPVVPPPATPVVPPPPPPAPAGSVSTTPTTPQALTSPYPGAILLGGTAADTLTASQGPDQLTGGGGADVFTFKAMPWSAGRITDFTATSDKLDLRSLITNGYAGSDLVSDGYVRFVTDGAGGSKVLVDVDGPGGVSSISYHVTTLIGVAPNSLSLSNLVGAPIQSPAPAAPPAPISTSAGLVLVSGSPGSALMGGVGNDTLVASQGSDSLTGGAGADIFMFKAMPWSAGRVLDFSVGADKLDLRPLMINGYAGSDPVADGYIRFVPDGLGGAKVIVDIDGPNGPSNIGFHVTTLQNVAPASLSASDLVAAAVPTGASPPSQPTAGLTLTSGFPGAKLQGSGGNDTLIASRGADELTGGAGADAFVFGAAPWQSGHITDFVHGVDLVDLRSLAVGYTGGNPGRDIMLTSDGSGGTLVKVDLDGPTGNQWPYQITTLDHVAPSTLSVSGWIIT